MDQVEKKDFPSLPFWATVAFVARSGQRFVPLYSNDRREPASSRIAVELALRLGQERAAIGGQFGLGNNAMCIDDQYFDHYDLEALGSGLMAANQAADATDRELCEDPQISLVTSLILAVTSLANIGLVLAFGEDIETGLTLDFPNTDSIVSSVVHWSSFANENVKPNVANDLELIYQHSLSGGWNNETAIPANIFGELGQYPLPKDWPN